MLSRRTILSGALGLAWQGQRARGPRRPVYGPTTLGIDGTTFTLNGGRAFLLGISYYAGLGASDATVRADLDAMQATAFCWLRVWATWTAFADISAVDPDGAPREPYMGRMRALVAECDRRGLVVDVTLSRGDAGLHTLDAHTRAVEALVDALRYHRNWYLDLSNERNIRDARHTPAADLARLREDVRRRLPGLLVTASHGGDVERGDLRAYIRDARLDFLTPHRPREPGSAAQTEEKTHEYLKWAEEAGRAVPVHYQEPFRRGYGSWEPAAADFAQDLAGARAGGAAGWCFHNGATRGKPEERPRRSFDLRDHSLFGQLDVEERAFVALLAREKRR